MHPFIILIHFIAFHLLQYVVQLLLLFTHLELAVW